MIELKEIVKMGIATLLEKSNHLEEELALVRRKVEVLVGEDEPSPT